MQDLSNNPVTQEDNYRLRVIEAIPSLEVLDCIKVTEEERAKASTLHRKVKSNARNRSPKSNTKRDDFPFTQSICTKLLMKDLERYESKREREILRERESALSRTEAMKRSMTNVQCPIAKNLDFSRSDHDTVWTEYDLYECFRDADNDGVGELSKDQLRRALEDMADLGRRPLLTVDDEGSSSSVAATDVVSPDTPSLLDIFLDGVTDRGTRTVTWEAFSMVTRDGQRCPGHGPAEEDRVLRLEWEPLSLDDAKARVDDWTKEASKATEAMLLLDDGADPTKREALRDRSFHALKRVNRLRRVLRRTSGARDVSNNNDRCRVESDTGGVLTDTAVLFGKGKALKRLGLHRGSDAVGVLSKP